MKISDVKKFRKEIYAAIDEALGWGYKAETSSAILKNHRAFEKSMTEFNHYDNFGGQFRAISLAQYMKITHNDKTIFLTVDEDGVDFYINEPEYFKYIGGVTADWYKNRMVYSMVVMREIIEKLQ